MVMGLLLESTGLEVLCAILVVLWNIYINITQHFNYWKDKGVPHAQPTFPFGTHKSVYLGKLHLAKLYEKYYHKFKGERYFGFYDSRKPVLIIKDPELIKQILTKDFNYFSDRFSNPLNKLDYTRNDLVHLRGKDWKNMRLKLTPSFTTGRMKEMFLLMVKCSEILHNHVNETVIKDNVVDTQDILGRFSMDIIASCAFGLEINCLTNKDSEFYSYGKRITKSNFLSIIKQFIFLFFPILTKWFTSPLVSKDISDFFKRVVKDTVEYREKNHVSRKDVLQLLINMGQNKNVIQNGETTNKNEEKNGKISPDQTALTIEEITAQCFIFITAGFESSSFTISFCLYELAHNPEIQERLYSEIRDVLERHDGNMSYYALQEMPYMDKVINETLRRHPSSGYLIRTCTETYKVPDSDLVLEIGQRISIPVLAIHHNPEHYPDPYQFDPERFSADKVKDRHTCLHLPFGEGPRMCIAMRFGLMQIKVGLATMVLNFKFGLASTTQIPITLNKRSFLIKPEKPILLQVTRR